MTDHKFTDDDVIKTLKNAKYKVDGVVTRGYYLSPETFNAVVDLIGRQEAEIERFVDIDKTYSEVRTEAIKEFAKILKSESIKTDRWGKIVLMSDIYTLVKEMTEKEV
jgi:hypothetical protein